MDGSTRYSAVVARSDDDPEEVNSSNNSNNKNWKLPTTDKMIQQRSHVEFTLRTVREEVRQWGELSMNSKAKAELCEGIRLKLNAEAGLNNFGVVVLSEAGLGEWPLPFLVVKESFVSELNKKTIQAISLKYSGF